MATYSGYLPDNVALSPTVSIGSYDITTSPSGVYFGVLNDAGIWGVAKGSNPTLDGCCASGKALLNNGAFPSNGQYTAGLQGDGNFVVRTLSGNVVAATNSNPIPSNPPYFAQITDTGGFIIGSGPNPAHSTGTIYSNPGFNQAVTGITITGITYGKNTTSFSTVALPGTTYTDINNDNRPQQFNNVTTYTDTTSDSYSFSTASAVGHSIGSMAGFNVFGVVANVSFGKTYSTTITNGKSTTSSFSKADGVGVRPTVDPNSELMVQVFGQMANFDIDYTWSGIATYADNTTAAVTGTGTYTGQDVGNYTAVVSCVYENGSKAACGAPTTVPALVPEPASLFLSLGMAAGLLATRVAQNRRRCNAAA